jgi:hypothetical protein
VRAAGYKVWDVHSPFPIHGIDAVIGIRPTILPWLVLCGGLTGSTALDSVVHQRPRLSIPDQRQAVLQPSGQHPDYLRMHGALLGADGGVRHAGPQSPAAALQPALQDVTNDKFFIYIDASDAKFDEGKTTDFLKSIGAAAVETVED